MKKHQLINLTLVLSFIAILFSCIQKPKETDRRNPQSKTLYNGINLPDQWPPHYNEPDEPGEMPVPYLENKPEVISINIGRQLFVDDFLIAETNLDRVCHKPVDFPGNPVLKPDREWEYTNSGRPYAAPFSDGVWYDEKDEKFKMWYLAGAGKAVKYHGFYTCYAESFDGKTWKKPELDIIPGTNIVDTFQRDAATIWLDKSEKNPEKKYKFFNVEAPWRIVLKYSSDGIHWSKGVAQSDRIGDRSTAFFNPFINKWVLSLRYNRIKPDGVLSRERHYVENQDPELLVSSARQISADAGDKNIVYWYGPDPKEQRNPEFPDFNPGIYNLDAIAYESIILGFFIVHKGPENSVCAELGIPKRNEISLGYSRDGFHFYRPTYDVFLGVNESSDAWNYGNVQSVNGAPLIVGDSLYFYRSGRRLNNIYNDSHMSTGLATLRRDGFISMKAGNQEGYLKTEILTFSGQNFFVNANVEKGSLLVELLDEKGNPLKGFKKKDCLPMEKENSTKRLITWRNNKDLSALKGKNIRIKFYLTEGELFAFWISPWKTGESYGHTAGGGPGLSSDGIDKPLN